MKKIFLLQMISILILLSPHSFAQGPVSLHCANILPNGNIQIKWVNPTPNANLIFRAIYKDGINIATINVDTVTTYLDTQGDGNIQATFDILSSYLPSVFKAITLHYFLTSVNDFNC
ncbi:MAG: hypothetical protein IPO63_01060 [Bacteroidetes bacterium]|nr:hypothetical protein [Bacteroidota bacterium]